MMLEWLGEGARAAAVGAAVAEVVARGEVRTYDLGGSATTSQMAEAVARHTAFGVRAGRVR
jgi:isocitrate/isopropylmalate dehydrogenase